MRYEILRPQPPLDAYVEVLWYYDDLDVAHERERILPHATFEFILNLGDQPRTLFSKNPAEGGRAFRRAWIAGAQREPIEIDAIRGTSLMGAHFRPGGAAPLFGHPASLWTDDVMESDDLWGSTIRSLRDRILEQATPRSKLMVLAKWLASRVNQERDQAVAYALSRWSEAPHLSRIDTVAAELGLSHKHLIHRFTSEVGLSPKRYCRILRFRRVLETIQAQRTIDWADLASACGYYDQSHFIQEFRGFSGLNPSQYLRMRGEHLGYVPLPCADGSAPG